MNFLKRCAVALALVAVSGAAFAGGHGHGHGHGYGHGHRGHGYHGGAYLTYAPAPVYYGGYYPPAPRPYYGGTYYNGGYYGHNSAAPVVGALIGGAIGNQFGHGDGRAAATIVGRVETAIASNKLHADTLGRVDDATIRACGVSGNKLLALRDLAARAQRGEIPDARRMATMRDDEVVQALVPVRGIGRWTVEMMLMFRLGRPDVLPVDDLGIRKGAQRVDRRAEMQTPRALAERGERWGPYRTYASLYLWRIADFAETPKPPVKRSQG